MAQLTPHCLTLRCLTRIHAVFAFYLWVYLFTSYPFSLPFSGFTHCLPFAPHTYCAHARTHASGSHTTAPYAPFLSALGCHTSFHTHAHAFLTTLHAGHAHSVGWFEFSLGLVCSLLLPPWGSLSSSLTGLLHTLWTLLLWILSCPHLLHGFFYLSRAQFSFLFAFHLFTHTFAHAPYLSCHHAYTPAHTPRFTHNARAALHCTFAWFLSLARAGAALLPGSSAGFMHAWHGWLGFPHCAHAAPALSPRTLLLLLRCAFCLFSFACISVLVLFTCRFWHRCARSYASPPPVITHTPGSPLFLFRTTAFAYACFLLLPHKNM